jgi:hypothetical protein
MESLAKASGDTEQWWPLSCKGDIKEIVKYIAADQRGFCAPPEVSTTD